MEINLLLISKLCFCIIKEHKVRLESCNAIPDISELYAIIYDLYPAMDAASYTLYWRFSATHYITLKDYLSFGMAVSLMTQPDVLLLVNDCDVECLLRINTQQILGYFEWQEERRSREMKRSKYDFPIAGKSEDDDQGQQVEKEADGETGENITEARQELDLRKKDFEILTYALKRRLELQSEPYCFTADLVFRTQVINCMKKGWPKLLNKLTPPTDVVIDRKKLPTPAPSNRKAKKAPSTKQKTKKMKQAGKS